MHPWNSSLRFARIEWWRPQGKIMGSDCKGQLKGNEITQMPQSLHYKSAQNPRNWSQNRDRYCQLSIANTAWTQQAFIKFMTVVPWNSWNSSLRFAWTDWPTPGSNTMVCAQPAFQVWLHATIHWDRTGSNILLLITLSVCPTDLKPMEHPWSSLLCIFASGMVTPRAGWQPLQDLSLEESLREPTFICVTILGRFISPARLRLDSLIPCIDQKIPCTEAENSKYQLNNWEDVRFTISQWEDGKFCILTCNWIHFCNNCLLEDFQNLVWDLST